METLASMDDIVERLINEDILVPIVAIVFGCLTGMCAIIFCSIRGMVTAKTREQTRREVAAYVAEGTMRSEEGVALLNAGTGSEDWDESSA